MNNLKASMGTLTTVAAVGAVAVVTMSSFYKYSFEKRLSQTTIYQESMQTLRNCEKVVNHFGEPIKEGRITVGEYEEDLRWLTVSLRGSKTGGKLHCEFRPNVGDSQPSIIRRLEVEFNDRPGVNYLLMENVEGSES